ncbi:Uma2 family endonuclease [Alicyclobacillus shizuokensis]|uniref:Uma2 family endonuclease n=1 Tax=Alicyclobacillus shizuokensis TaxID=392014 RepID=UPI0008361D66|nr:Uma2 family endonuclease [Alicyclobacillus shizuokensis]MCL6627723.1 Uma2 family endonuclease [Alicyclobacillus shizuokensis]
MSVNRIDFSKRYTLKDYLSWDTDERYELLDGVPYLMTSPSSWHQQVSMNLSGFIWNYLRSKGSPCRVYTAPTDLLLFDAEDNLNAKDVVQPDIFVICGGQHRRMVSGVPIWVIEILSPSTVRKDKIIKLRTYEQARVGEYWIIDPLTQYVQVFVLDDNGRYSQNQIHERNEKVKVSVLDDFEISLSEVFGDEIAIGNESE